ncbi:MAG: hypothetical protein K2P81_11125 [Bacteriovoracaceae bacterium]|nr:hypothetical protein [Bacteriovoracaceae bacterium]
MALNLGVALAPLLTVERSPQELDDHTLVIADEEGAPEIEELLKVVPRSLLFWIGRQDDATHIEFIQKHQLSHLLGFDPIRTPWEAALNLKKILNKKMWGASQYLDAGTMTDGFSLSESKREMDKIKEILTSQDWSDFFDSPVEYLTLVSNELISNALYNGPELKREHAHYPIDRKEPVFLKGSELIQLNIGLDSHCAVLSVMDCFGSLSKEKVIESLARSFKEKTVQNKKGGAGLGLYLAFTQANQFIVNRKAGTRTEVICLIEKNRRYKQFKGRIKSFHFFEEA